MNSETRLAYMQQHIEKLEARIEALERIVAKTDEAWVTQETATHPDGYKCIYCQRHRAAGQGEGGET